MGMLGFDYLDPENSLCTGKNNRHYSEHEEWNKLLPLSFTIK